MIKPASGRCNMRCGYCFYSDEVSRRKGAICSAMSRETLEQTVKKTLAVAEGTCTFAFQGGEPTLAGLDFFRELLVLEKAYNIHGVQIHHALQTNGILLDRTWTDFLAEHQFLVGLSLDGSKEIHDRIRIDAQGRGTYSRVMHAVQLLKSSGTDFNILTTVTADVAKAVHRIYGFYRRNGLLYQQYTPCLDPIGEVRGKRSYALTPERYASFLRALFDLWYDDVVHGRFIYIRYFENLVGMLLGEAPESCSMYGSCTRQYVVEADGSVYPCDFYALDAYCLGNMVSHSFDEMDRKRSEISFIEMSRMQHESCTKCKWQKLCRGGCRRDRENHKGEIALNYFCSSYKAFFEYAAPRLVEIARHVRRPVR